MKLCCNQISKSYKRRLVVNKVSIDVFLGETVGLLGPNGAGKTTSFYIFVGLIQPSSGQVFLGENNITHLPMYKRARLGISYLPQEASIFRNLTVRQNLECILQYHHFSKKDIRNKVNELLEEFGISHVMNAKGYTLSGGERRRVEIARSLILNPKFILLDEPFAGIDPIAVEDIQEAIKKLKHKNIGVLITDHNVRETLSITDRAYLLFEGKMIKEGTSEYLAHDKESKELYLGKNFYLNTK